MLSDNLLTQALHTHKHETFNVICTRFHLFHPSARSSTPEEHKLTFFKFLRRTYIISVQILMRAIRKNRIPMPLYIPFKQSIVTYTHIENFFWMPEHKLVQKRKTFRKFGVQTFALIKLNNWQTCLCFEIESA